MFGVSFGIFIPTSRWTAGVVFDLISVLQAPPNPLSELVRYVDETVKQETQETSIAAMGTNVVNVLDHLERLNDSTTKDPDYHLSIMKDYLYNIISLLMKDAHHLRESEYPAFAVPKLFAITPIAAIVSEYLQKQNIKEDISCLYAAAIKQYFHPFLYDRLRRIEVMHCTRLLHQVPCCDYCRVYDTILV